MLQYWAAAAPVCRTPYLWDPLHLPFDIGQGQRSWKVPWLAENCGDDGGMQIYNEAHRTHQCGGLWSWWDHVLGRLSAKCYQTPGQGNPAEVECQPLSNENDAEKERSSSQKLEETLRSFLRHTYQSIFRTTREKAVNHKRIFLVEPWSAQYHSAR